MTFQDRVTALAPLGFTPRQTRFLVTAALHSGYCLRRQYLAFAGVRHGKNVRDFFDGLVARDLAHRLQYQPNRGHIYQLHATGLYRALGQRDNRNRRRASAAVVARKLMLLDYVLTVSDAEWYATEDDKVALFAREYDLSRRDLPQRVYASTAQSGPATTRYFLQKLPLYRPAGGVVHFVYLVTDETGAGLAQFLHDHVRLFSALPGWTVVAVCPRTLNGFPASQATFDRFVATTWRPAPPEDRAELRWFFATRQLVERGDLRALSAADLDRFQEARQRLANAQIDALYSGWLQRGEAVLGEGHGAVTAGATPAGELILRESPFAYSQFGPLPGVC